MDKIRNNVPSVIQPLNEKPTSLTKLTKVGYSKKNDKKVACETSNQNRKVLKEKEINKNKHFEEQPCSSTSENSFELQKQYDTLKARSERNKDILRKLRLVKHHKEKNDIANLDKLIKKWRSVSQEALTELLTLTTQQPPPSMLQLIHYLSIKPEVVGFNVDTEEFDEVLE